MEGINRYKRKTAPGVKAGRVREKSCSKESPTYWNTNQKPTIIDREEPGKGFRHYLRKRDILRFIGLLPEWDVLSRDLNVILLSRGQKGTDGWYAGTVIAISAWERDPWRSFDAEYYHEHRELLDKIGVPCAKNGSGYLCEFTDATIRAFQLLHIFLHELGHHYDRITSHRRAEAGRGEYYAENYALQYQEYIWRRFIDNFDL